MPSASDDYRGAKDCFLSGWGFIEKRGNKDGTRADQLQKVKLKANQRYLPTDQLQKSKTSVHHSLYIKGKILA